MPLSRDDAGGVNDKSSEHLGYKNLTISLFEFNQIKKTAIFSCLNNSNI